MIIDQGLNFQPINAENKGEGIIYLTQQGVNGSDDLVIVTPEGAKQLIKVLQEFIDDQG